MYYANRIDNYKKIEQARKSKLLVYISASIFHVF